MDRHGSHILGGMQKKKRSEKVAIEEFLESTGEKRTFLKNILRRKVNWVGIIIRRSWLVRDVIEGQMTEMKSVGIRVRTEHFDDLRNTR